MYYRYKRKKKNIRFVRLLIILGFAAAALYAGNRYKQHIFFWKYTYNRLIAEVEAKNSGSTGEERRKNLLGLVSIVNEYTRDNQVDPEACFLSGKLNYYIGLTYLEGRFSELYINNRFPLAGRKACARFRQSIRDIKKGIALLGGDNINSESAMILAWSLYYTGFAAPAEILKTIQYVKENDGLKSVEDARLYACLMIMNGREEEGLKLLNEQGGVEESIEGTLFLATAEKSAKRFTNAIVHYQDMLGRVKNERLKKLVHVNLGEIYFHQSLYRESLEQFLKGLEIDSTDNNLRIWIGKSYMELGEKEKARTILNEVYASDSANQEVKKLLGVM